MKLFPNFTRHHLITHTNKPLLFEQWYCFVLSFIVVTLIFDSLKLNTVVNGNFAKKAS